MRIQRPHISVENPRRATIAMAVSHVLAELTGQGWEVFVPFGRTQHAHLVALTLDGKVVPIECRSAIIHEGEEKDSLFFYPDMEVPTMIAVVDNRDGEVFYVKAEDVVPDPEPDLAEEEPIDVHGVRLGQLEESGEMVE